jgi:phosphoglycerate dehydrogenase-like enzyme
MKKLLVIGNETTPQFKLLSALSDFYQIEVQHSSPEQTDAEALLAWEVKKDELENLVKNSSSLKWIHTKSAGVESLLSDGLRSSAVVLTNAQGVFADSLAEFVLMGMLYFAKDLSRMNENKDLKKWEQYPVGCLKGTKIGILGYGGIGQQIAQRCIAFGMEVVSFRTKVKESGEIVDQVKIFPVTKFDESIGEFDYLAMSLPSTAETKKFLNAERIAKMKSTALLINVGRGATVDEEALIQALEQKKIKGAVLDVFAVEPLEASSKLWNLENVILSPHTADQTDTWLDETMEKFIENAKLYCSGEELLNVVDKMKGY